MKTDINTIRQNLCFEDILSDCVCVVFLGLLKGSAECAAELEGFRMVKERCNILTNNIQDLYIQNDKD